jgi:hypothetical protein
MKMRFELKTYRRRQFRFIAFYFFLRRLGVACPQPQFVAFPLRNRFHDPLALSFTSHCNVRSAPFRRDRRMQEVRRKDSTSSSRLFYRRAN